MDIDSSSPDVLSTLPNGDIFVNRFSEKKIYSPAANTWRTLTSTSSLNLDFDHWIAPNCKVFSNEFLPSNFYYIDTAGNGNFTAFPGLPDGVSVASDSVMYQPGKLYYPSGIASLNNLGPYQIDITGSTPSLIAVRESNTDAYRTATADIVKATGSSLITIDALANDSGIGLVLNKPNAWLLQGGRVALVNKKVTYKPKVGFNGVDKIWYVFRDAQGRTNSGVKTITVSGNSSNNSTYPVAKQDYVTTTTGTKVAINVLANDTGSGLVLNAPNVWTLKGGRVALVSNQLVYISRSGFTGSDKIWYTFKDNQGRSNSGQVNITVKSASSIAFPVAKADYYTTAKNAGKVLDILANDTTSGGIAIVTLYAYTAKGGWTNKTTNGKVWYKPKTGFIGEDNFWYVMIDAQGRKNSAQVKINVK